MRSRSIFLMFIAASVLAAHDAGCRVNSGAISLFIDPSVRGRGMGDASTAAFWGDEPNYWSNPALLGYHHGIHYEWSNTQLVPSLADDVFFKSQRVTLGAWGIGVGLMGRPLNSMCGTFLDYGESEAVGADGQSLGTFRSFEDVDSWAVGVNLVELSESLFGLGRHAAPHPSRYGDISLGYARKRVLVNLAPASVLPDPTLGDAIARAETHDLGLLVRLTPYNSADRTKSRDTDSGLQAVLGGVRLDLAYGKGILNHSDEELVFLDAEQADPIARDTRDGFGVRLSSGFPRAFHGLSDNGRAGWVSRLFTPLISWGMAWDWDRLSIPAGSGRDKGSLVKQRGWELTLANVYTIRAGRVDDEDGAIHGTSSGWSLGLRLGDVAGFRLDRAEVPQAEDLERPRPKGYSWFVDGVALYRGVRRSRNSQLGSIAAAPPRVIDSQVLQPTPTGPVSEPAPKILLKRGFWNTKFTFDGGEPAKVHAGIGAYTDHFQEVMRLHPQALRTAKGAYKYNALSFICATGFAVSSAVEFAATIRKAQEVRQGNSVDAGPSARGLVTTVSLAAGTAIFSVIARSKLHRGVQEFNRLQEQDPRRLADFPERGTR